MLESPDPSFERRGGRARLVTAKESGGITLHYGIINYNTLVKFLVTSDSILTISDSLICGI